MKLDLEDAMEDLKLNPTADIASRARECLQREFSLRERNGHRRKHRQFRAKSKSSRTEHSKE